jgi:hypothetical protein
MRLVEHDQVVEALATDRSDQALDVGILLRARWCGDDFTDAHACDRDV